jgi:hypothetical protein
MYNGMGTYISVLKGKAVLVIYSARQYEDEFFAPSIHSFIQGLNVFTCQSEPIESEPGDLMCFTSSSSQALKWAILKSPP